MTQAPIMDRTWTDAERQAWALPEKVTVSEWADRNRILDTLTSAEPGPWRTARTPYLRGIMDAFNDPFVEDITIMASTQIGKTECELNMMGYIIDQDPGPTLLVMPRDEDAKSMSSNRVKPMIKLSEALESHFTSREDDISKKEFLLDRMIMYFTGSNSPAGLSNRPIKYLFLDETDKYPHYSGKEADPIKLATERTRTFWNRKIVKCSTPTTKEGYIYNEYGKTDRCKFYVPCPYCGEYQLLLWPQIKFPEEERDPEKIKEQRLAWYECLKCKGKINDLVKQRMLIQGRWVPEGCEINEQGRMVGNIPRTSRKGFWINALYSPWLTFSEIAAEHLRAYQYIEQHMNFVNSWLAEVWEENLGQSKPDELKKLALDYPAGLVPAGVRVLVAAVDVQKDYFVLVINGWGPMQESWRILSTTLETWEEVEKILFDTRYPSEISNTEPFSVKLANFDTGYRTDEVYEFCRKHKGIARAIKGRDHLDGVPFKVRSLDKFPSGKNLPGGLNLWHIDTSYF
ncbi:MAG: terminase gpA endonuclease subunit, partial [Smithella sp.]